MECTKKGGKKRKNEERKGGREKVHKSHDDNKK